MIGAETVTIPLWPFPALAAILCAGIAVGLVTFRPPSGPRTCPWPIAAAVYLAVAIVFAVVAVSTAGSS